jgi:hypothetical protein
MNVNAIVRLVAVSVSAACILVLLAAECRTVFIPFHSQPAPADRAGPATSDGLRSMPFDGH